MTFLKIRFTIGDCAAGHRAENRAKNRNVLVVPPDSYRPYLTSTVGGSSGGGAGDSSATDYVNAVFVDGHRRADEFVVTEWPMSNTSSQFWSLAHDFDLRTIVVLNQHPRSAAMPGNLAVFPPFWPQQQDGKVNYGPIFCVEQKSCRSYQDKFTVWQLNLMKQDISPKK